MRLLLLSLLLVPLASYAEDGLADEETMRLQSQLSSLVGEVKSFLPKDQVNVFDWMQNIWKSSDGAYCIWVSELQEDPASGREQYNICMRRLISQRIDELSLLRCENFGAISGCNEN